MHVDKNISKGRMEELVNRFTQNREAYLSSSYNETQVRVEYINPFWKCLGWDVDNEEGAIDAYKEVIHELRERASGHLKAPDYCFKINNDFKFYVEAKKPGIDLKTDPNPAYQIRNYGWNKKLAVSVLTDFEEFVVYDCGKRPMKGDKPAVGRLKYLTYPEYLQEFDFLWDTFSKEAVRTGRFDKYARAESKARGGETVDKEFLKSMDVWRVELAKNIAVNNPKIASDEEVSRAVQLIIDRILFLRVCEGRGVEHHDTLREKAGKDDFYKNLCGYFETADQKYNSGLFDFKKDTLTLGLTIDDKVVKSILNELYEGDYNFSIIPVEILGNAYEQFLGKVIRLTVGHHAKVEEKPEIRKAGGVYYTPQYIVDYIVKNTVGKLLEGKTPKEAAKLHICDPACGSGSFLLGAFQYLLDWHLKWYIENPDKMPSGKKAESPLTPTGRLNTAEKKRILLNNIFGVDIDPQAVEVTKLSLLLKAMEGETEASVHTQLALWHEPVLPSLENNIKCGNSLIGPDYFSGQLAPDTEELKRVNPFDWKAAFPEIFKVGGFDAVIGNPPYVRIQGFPSQQIKYFCQKYHGAVGNFDLYIIFLEKAFVLLSKEGLSSFILPNKFFKTDYGVGIRKFLSEQNAIRKIIDFGSSQVFEATTYTCILLLDYGQKDYFFYALIEAEPLTLISHQDREIKASTLNEASWDFGNESFKKILDKISLVSKPLLELPAEMSRGSSSGADDIFMIDNSNEEQLEPGSLRIPLFATDFGRYCFSPLNKWMIIFPYQIKENVYQVIPEEQLKQQFSKTYSYLLSNQQGLKKRKQFKDWYGFSAPRNLYLHESAQIAVPLLADRGLFALIPQEYRKKICPMASGGFTINISVKCNLDQRFILGLLNSRLLFWILRLKSNIFRGGWITCTKQYFGNLPIKVIDFENETDKLLHKEIVLHVDSIVELHKRLAATESERERESLQRLIDDTDHQIDALVYKLYGLTEEEINIVEESQ
jgi:adenine-specific DNA-methyltransferase